jgi:hypothetical protein
MDDETFSIEAEPQGLEIPSWLWFTLLAAGWLIFELTAEPVLVVLAACGKVGWKDLWAASWLRKRDPDWQRGKTIRWFYVAHGSWKITMTAFCTFLILLPLIGARQPNQNIDDIALSLTASIGLCLLFFTVSAGTTALATLLAWSQGIRVWVDTTVNDSRRRDVWPPKPYGPNRLSRLLTTAASFFIILTLFAALFGMSALLKNMKNVNQGMVGLITSMTIIVSAAVVLGIRERVLKQIGAKHPRQCWELVELEVVDPRSAAVSPFLPAANEDSHVGF